LALRLLMEYTQLPFGAARERSLTAHCFSTLEIL
jgi:hypothetical protein